MNIPSPCADCGIPRRPHHTLAADWPGTRIARGRHLCDRCARLQRAAEPAATYDPMRWVESALCAQVDGEEWFPEQGGSNSAAKAVCGRCDVTAECLDYALRNDELQGVWGGTSPQERRRLRKATA